MSTCILCNAPGGVVLWRDDFCRVVLADEPDYPGFMRVILTAHVKEMTDLSAEDQRTLLQVVLATEGALREVMAPDKVNLASLGNLVPHLHWHVIPRFADDPRFPDPVWGERKSGAPRTTPPDVAPRLAAALRRRLGPARETE